MRALKSLALALLATAVALPALAGQPVSLRSDISDPNGRVTLGELFDNAGAAADVEVAVRSGPSVVLDATRVQQLARRYGLDWDNPRGLMRIIVRAQGGTASVSGNQEILTWARSFNTGEVIQPQDMVWARAAALPADAPRNADQVIGMVARHPLRAGDAVGAHDVSSPIVIKTGDTVSVIYQDGGVTLTLQGKAMGNASVGDSVNIQNTASKKLIEAVASGADQALVGPEAMRLKAEHNPSQLALR